MPRKKNADVTTEFEEALKSAPKQEKYILKLYITGMTPRSKAAIENIRKITSERLDGNFELEIIDLYQQPALAKGEQIIAVPTLIKKLPLPLRQLVGDLSSEERIVVGLDLKSIE
jgi:circadian clock protein KaiB